ncbi:MAG: hypothetical protein H0X66_22305 [Verrucomicrobia bacterium]|nr:hypothetical protein [Verrucomicrobiota bacterium]
MPTLPHPRPGDRLEVKGRQIPFSFWPTRPAGGHHALQSLLFAVDPWIVIRESITVTCGKAQKAEALACLEQARDFFVAATEAGVVAARPLVLYYSFMNLVKAFCLTRGTRATFDQAQHGLSEKKATGARELTGAYLEAFRTPNGKGEPNNFAEFMLALLGTNLPAPSMRYDLLNLLPQIVPGHRLWAQAAKKTERFIAIQEIQFRHDRTARQVWLEVYFVRDDLTRLGISHQRLASESLLNTTFREIQCDEIHNDRELICYEQITPYTYANYPADELQPLIQLLRQKIWLTVATVPPYRRHYVYLSPPAERAALLPQLLSIYAITYYLGSITRYRPHHFDAIAATRFGPRIQEFITSQPLQFVYLLASEFARQDVTRPSII